MSFLHHTPFVHVQFRSTHQLYTFHFCEHIYFLIFCVPHIHSLCSLNYHIWNVHRLQYDQMDNTNDTMGLNVSSYAFTNNPWFISDVHAINAQHDNPSLLHTIDNLIRSLNRTARSMGRYSPVSTAQNMMENQSMAITAIPQLQSMSNIFRSQSHWEHSDQNWMGTFWSQSDSKVIYIFRLNLYRCQWPHSVPIQCGAVRGEQGVGWKGCSAACPVGHCGVPTMEWHETVGTEWALWICGSGDGGNGWTLSICELVDIQFINSYQKICICWLRMKSWESSMRKTIWFISPWR